MSDKSLCAKAEEQLPRETNQALSPCSPEESLRKLGARQLELQMQNEELRRAQAAMAERRDRYEDLFEFSPVSYISVSQHSLIGEINLTGAALLGLKRAELIDRPFADFVPVQERVRWKRLLASMMEHGGVEKYAFDMELTRADGSIFHAHLDCLRREFRDAAPVLRVALVDISKLKQTETELRIAAVAFESQEGMLVTDADGLIMRTNRAFSDITGYTAEEVIGKNLCIFQSGRHDAQFFESMWDAVLKNSKWQGEIWHRRKSGELYPIRFFVTAVRDQACVITNYVVTIMDITFSKAEEDKIKSLAFYDPLTGLPNRRLFMDRLNSAMISSDRTNHKGGLIFIDLDKFKDLNDSVGHELGDLLLQEVARRIEGCVREGDTVARFGGDEFVVILENLSESILEAAAQTEAVSHKILAEIARLVTLGVYEYNNHASIGMTLMCGKRRDMDVLLREADSAMYKSKKMGGDCISFFDIRMQKSINARINLENELRAAFTKNQFRLYYHLRENSSHKIIGAKAIVHWLHPQRGMAGPEYFIPVAEEMGLIVPIGDWIIESACAQIKAWSQTPLIRDLVLSVNVSAKQFHHAEFAAQVLTAIRRHAIAPYKLKLDVTENIFFGDIEAAIAKMHELKQVGIRFALNNVGYEYLSLRHLKCLPLDQLNISQIFVNDIDVDRGNLAIVRGIIAMAQALELDVLALGVDTEEQRRVLINQGCTRFEGYLFGRPGTAEQLEEALKLPQATIVR